MDCDKLSAHISSINCDISQIKEIDEFVKSKVNNIEVNGKLQEKIVKIVCYETFLLK